MATDSEHQTVLDILGLTGSTPYAPASGGSGAVFTDPDKWLQAVSLGSATTSGRTLQDVRQEAADGLGYDLGNTKGANLTNEERGKLVQRMAQIILSRPNYYPEAYYPWASKWAGVTIYDPYTLKQAAGDFFGEIGNQAVDLNNTLNPFSTENRQGLATTVKWLAIGAVVVVGAIYLAPYLAPKVKQAVNSLK